MLMKKITTLLLTLLTIGLFNIIQAQETIDSVLNERTALLKNVEAEKSAIVSPSVDNLEGLTEKQEEIIEADNTIIKEFLQPIVAQNKLYEEKINNFEKLQNEFQEFKKYFLYVIIGAGLFLVLSIIFLILYISANSKNKKLRSKLIKMERLQKEHQREIDSIQQELDNQKASFRKEMNRIKEEKAKHQKESEEQKARVKELENEKARIEAEYQDKVEAVKKDYETLIAELKSKGDVEQLKAEMEKQLQNKDMKIEELKTEKENISGELEVVNNKLKEKESQPVAALEEIEQLKKDNEKLLNEIGKINEDLKTEKDENYQLRDTIETINQEKQEAGTDKGEIESLQQKIKDMEMELDDYKENLERERNTKEKIQDELKKFIEEIKSFKLR